METITFVKGRKFKWAGQVMAFVLSCSLTAGSIPLSEARAPLRACLGSAQPRMGEEAITPYLLSGSWLTRIIESHVRHSFRGFFEFRAWSTSEGFFWAGQTMMADDNPLSGTHSVDNSWRAGNVSLKDNTLEGVRVWLEQNMKEAKAKGIAGIVISEAYGDDIGETQYFSRITVEEAIFNSLTILYQHFRREQKFNVHISIDYGKGNLIVIWPEVRPLVPDILGALMFIAGLITEFRGWSGSGILAMAVLRPSGISSPLSLGSFTKQLAELFQGQGKTVRQYKNAALRIQPSAKLDEKDTDLIEQQVQDLRQKEKAKLGFAALMFLGVPNGSFALYVVVAFLVFYAIRRWTRASAGDSEYSDKPYNPAALQKGQALAEVPLVQTEGDRASLQWLEAIRHNLENELRPSVIGPEDENLVAEASMRMNRHLDTLEERIRSGEIILSDAVRAYGFDPIEPLPDKAHGIVLVAVPGTFSPPHFGHLDLMLSALISASDRERGTPKIYTGIFFPIGDQHWGPDGLSLWKPDKIAAEHRHAMSQHAADLFYPLMRLSKSGLLNAESYNVENAVDAINLNRYDWSGPIRPNSIRPQSFYLAVGQDLYDRWKIHLDGALRDGHRRFPEVPIHLIVYGKGPEPKPVEAPYEVIVLDKDPLEIRSTKIRQSHRYALLPSAVRNYIVEQELLFEKKADTTASVPSKEYRDPPENIQRFLSDYFPIVRTAQELAPGGGGLSVIGAGLLWDVEKDLLVDPKFREVNLVDVDGQALREGAAHKELVGSPGTELEFAL